MTDLSKDILAADLKRAAEADRARALDYKDLAESVSFSANAMQRIAEVHKRHARRATSDAEQKEARLKELGY